jgi:hypothetical protein
LNSGIVFDSQYTALEANDLPYQRLLMVDLTTPISAEGIDRKGAAYA